MTDLLSQEQTQKDSLPKGWAQASFGDLAEYLNGRAFKKSDWGSTGRPIIRIQNLTGSSATLNRFSEPVEERYIVRNGDLLISWSATLGAYIYRGEEAVLNQHIFKVEPHVNRRFLFHLTNAYIDELRRQAHGSGMQHITKSKFENSEVPLPPLNEQHHIVEKLEELFTKLDAGVRALEETRALLKKYRRSVLKAAVEGELSREWREAHAGEVEPASELLERILRERREKFAGKKYKEPASPDTSRLPARPDGWEWASSVQLSSPEQYSLAIGPFGSNLKVEDYRASGVPLIFVRNIRSGDFSGRDTKYVTAEKAAQLKAHSASGGDILITKMGDPPGDACLYPENSPVAIITADCIKWRLSDLLSWKQIFVYFINSMPVHSQILKITRGVAQLKVSLGRFSEIGIPLPPLEEQRIIVEEVERRLSVVDKLEATIEANLKRAGGLRRSILAQAFSGGLVAQDPDDEPAGVLLERIRAERLATDQKSGKRKAAKDDEAQGRLL